MSGMLTTNAAAERIGLAPNTLEKLRCIGGGPRYCKLGKAVRYRVSDLEAYLDARVVGSTSERVAA